jgi:hypothetical protein
MLISWRIIPESDKGIALFYNDFKSNPMSYLLADIAHHTFPMEFIHLFWM